MKTTIKIIGFLFIYLFISTSAFASVEIDKNALMKKVSGLQMPFIENQGQIKDKSVRFYANTFAGTVFVTDKGEIVYSLIKTEDKAQNTENRQNQSLRPRIEFGGSNLNSPNSISKAVVLRESLVYSNQRPDDRAQNTDKIKRLNKSDTKVNYFKGAQKNWRSNIPTWQEVSLGEVYKGIELKLKAYGKNMEKLFTVHPKASVEDIKLKLEGAKSLKVNEDGELEVETELGTIKYTKPIAYQEKTVSSQRSGTESVQTQKRQYIEVAYVVNGNEYGFNVGDYDNTKPLIIDPLLASTFIGGSSEDGASTLAIDSGGNVFVAGYTSSSDFPTTPGAYDTTFNGDYWDVFVSKLNNNLSSLLSSTFIGGSSEDGASTLAIDSGGNVFVAGYTSSSDFPTTPGAYDTTLNRNGDAFVSKLNNNLSSLLSSTFIGGSSGDDAYALAIDSGGNVFVAGYTDWLDFPTTPGAYDTTFNGGIGVGSGDVFVSKLNNNLSSLLSSTFIGGSGEEVPSSLVLDSSGNIFVAGQTNSSGAYGYYPTTAGAYDTTFNGFINVFVSKLNNNLSSLLSSTFIGGYLYDYAEALAIDSGGNVFVAGYTSSSDYPVTSGAYDTTFNGGYYYDIYDVFVSKLDSNLSSLLSSTFIGGSSGDGASTLAIDSGGNVFVAGYTNSSDFPTTPGAYDTTFNGGSDDVFVSKLNNNLSSLLSSTFIGGSSGDGASTLAIDSGGNVFMAGYTDSSDFPTTPGAYDTTFNGGSGDVDVFVSKLDSNLFSVVDNDNDGYTSDVDCNDNDPAINPGATEVCDGVDNNCDGQIDEGGVCIPDLIISSLSVPSSANAGQVISISDTTKNQGTGAGDVSTTKFYLSTDATYNRGDTYLGRRGVIALATGASSSGRIRVTIPVGTPAGSYYIIAVADADRVIAESNEKNNNKTRAITIQ